jgi:glutamate-1-semialdehyde 2,1-aminomutase
VRPAADVVGRPLSADGELVRAYTERTPGSAAAFGAAGRVLPGGETRAVTSYPPYPLVITEGHGARLTDADLDDIAAAYAAAFRQLRPA